LRSAPARISNDVFFGVQPAEDVAQRVERPRGDIGSLLLQVAAADIQNNSI
jgi:hypothetical protein